MGNVNTPFTFYDYSTALDGSAQWKCASTPVAVFGGGSYAWLWYRRVFGHMEFVIRVVLSELLVNWPNDDVWSFGLPDVCQVLPFPDVSGLIFAGGGVGVTNPPFVVPAVAYNGVNGRQYPGVARMDVDDNGQTTVSPIFPIVNGTIGYVQVTTGQTGIGTSFTDLTSLFYTVDVPANHRIRITAGTYQWAQQTSAGIPQVAIFEGATELEQANDSAAASAYAGGLAPSIVLQPTEGSHTYKLAAKTTAGTVTMAAGSDQPAFLLIEDITGNLDDVSGVASRYHPFRWDTGSTLLIGNIVPSIDS